MRGLARPIAFLAAAVLVTGGVAPAQAIEPGADPFYIYSGSAPLASFAPGAVLATRTVAFSIASVPTPFATTQVLYRSTDQLGRPVANVTSVVRPQVAANGDLISYQSFYDSLNPADSPSRSIAGAPASVGTSINTAEAAVLTPLLAAGYTVNIADTEGQNADFAAGPEYGRLTLDSIRAASSTPGVTASTQVGMLGYSGGAIATNWAAALAPSYAPDVNQRLVGATEGGVLVAPARNLRYIDGAPIWGGVIGMALIGVARSFEIDFDPYLSDYGKQQLESMKNLPIGSVLGQYPDYRFAKLVKPEYADPDSIKPFVDAVNAINLGLAPSPTVPMQIRQGAGGEAEGTPGTKPGIGPGDGVMIAGDVRALARQYCAGGTSVDYAQYDAVSHTPGFVPWLAEAVPFLVARFAGTTPSSNCASIAPGNSLAAEVYRAPAPSRTRTRIRLPRVWQVRGKESTKVAFAVVSAGRTSGGAVAGRVVVRIDGAKRKTVSVPVNLKTGRAVVGTHLRLPRALAFGKHTVRLRFKPADPAAFTGSTSRTVTILVVRSRPSAR